ncbi:MAG: hypothetical protein HKN67_13225 [Saprospiraceae bacterium]|nr:hypothetical protein [Saprospiraceae bacterium]
MMNWEAISTIIQILGTFAVFASLVYLAIQVRQNSQIAQSSVRHAIAETIMSPPNNFIQSDSFRHAFIAHLNGKKITPDQELQLQVYCYMTLKSWENIYYQYQNGMLSNEEWRPMRENLKLVMQVIFYRTYWKREKHIYSSNFASEIDSILLEIENTGDHKLPKALAHLYKDVNCDYKKT